VTTTKEGRRSPLFEQYFGLKERYPEAILLMRVGDFYEAYGDDAETIARALQIALTSKESGGGERVAMAGVPHHALDGYLAKLVQQRRVVALAEQLEAPVPNKLTRRDVVRVVTPGTLLEESLLPSSANNFLAAVASVGEALAVAYADVSTGELGATAFAGDSALEDALAELARLTPAEAVLDVPFDERDPFVGVLEQHGARIAQPGIGAVDGRRREPLAGFSLEESVAIHRALDALYAFTARSCLGGAEALRSPQAYRAQTFMVIDPASRRNLELTKAVGSNPKATLLATLDRCRTGMGSRLLARWLLAPLVERERIVGRQEAVRSLVEEYPRRASLQEQLERCYDLERLAQRLRIRRVGARDLAALRRTLETLEPLRALASTASLEAMGRRIEGFAALRDDIAATLVDDPPASLADGGAIRGEASAELAECVALRSGARERIAALEERERARTGIKSLKIRYTNAFGYAIEVTSANVGGVPGEYVRKQTLTNGERFVTPELKELELAIASAQSRQQRLEEALFAQLVERVAAHAEALMAAADALAHLDTLCSLAQVAGERGYVRPEIVEASRIEIAEGRHPVVEVLLGERFVPNALRVEEREHRFLILTGPNMGGKSTYLRQAALLVILAQIGSYVPARAAQVGVIDRIFTRIGAGDDLASGQSTFYLEMAEAAHILRRCTARSLVVVDEIGRGTGTVDGLAIAQAICEYLLGMEGDAPIVLFATHFHELVELAGEWPRVANYHVTAVEHPQRGGEPVFSHRVLPGSTNRSFGIEVARMAGLPASVVERARALADELLGRTPLERAVPLRKNLARERGEMPRRQLDLGLS
ncbi:MAG: DNA mismatch repair protein MutS, partial [bacterium]|nr:DNA mismatch repair protein MutS [bacterium]